MKVYYTDEFVLPLPEAHTFPMAKYRLLRGRIESSGLLARENLRAPPAASDAELERAHDRGYLSRVAGGGLTADEVKRIGFPWSPGLVERSRRSSGATLWALRSALADGCGVNLAGGTHHAFRDRGEGYCVFNDAVVAIRNLQYQGLVRRAVVIDCDVHQGNGTAALCRHDDSVFTFSVHGARNFPIKKERSDLDIALPDGTGDRDYLDALAGGLRAAVSRARADAAVYLAGADPFAGDRLGRLSLTLTGLAERDRMVFDVLRAAGLPFAVAMAGGYARDVNDTVAAHWQTVRRALDEFALPPTMSAGQT